MCDMCEREGSAVLSFIRHLVNILAGSVAHLTSSHRCYVTIILWLKRERERPVKVVLVLT